MEYKIIQTVCPRILEAQVTALLDNGYKLQGGVSVSKNNYGDSIDKEIYTQALYK